MIVQAFEYEKQGGSENVGRLEDFFVSTEGKFSTPFVKSIVDKLNCQRNSIKAGSEKHSENEAISNTPDQSTHNK